MNGLLTLPAGWSYRATFDPGDAKKRMADADPHYRSDKPRPLHYSTSTDARPEGFARITHSEGIRCRPAVLEAFGPIESAGEVRDALPRLLRALHATTSDPVAVGPPARGTHAPL